MKSYDHLPDGASINPAEFNTRPERMRCFVIKSYAADDVHKSIKYGVWASTEHGNKRLDEAFRSTQGDPKFPVYLFFSVNGSGFFCGMAQMMSPVDYSKKFGAWAQSEKWSGQFKVKWIFIKVACHPHVAPYSQRSASQCWDGCCAEHPQSGAAARALALQPG